MIVIASKTLKKGTARKHRKNLPFVWSREREQVCEGKAKKSPRRVLFLAPPTGLEPCDDARKLCFLAANIPCGNHSPLYAPLVRRVSVLFKVRREKEATKKTTNWWSFSLCLEVNLTTYENCPLSHIDICAVLFQNAL